jgi:hypothetical protein
LDLAGNDKATPQTVLLTLTTTLAKEKRIMAEQILSKRDQRNQETVPAKIEKITTNSFVVGCLLAFVR